jgi:hypothetical protein
MPINKIAVLTSGVDAPRPAHDAYLYAIFLACEHDSNAFSLIEKRSY